MRVVMHLYKSHDSDLVSLHKSGYSISKLARKVIEAYAHGERCKYLIPECKKIDLSDVPTNSKGGLRVEFNTSDEETIRLLNSIANNRRNQFCKAMVRNSFVEQPLAVFFTNPDVIRQENDFLQSQMKSGVICLPSKNKKSSKYEELTKGMKPEFPHPLRVILFLGKALHDIRAQAFIKAEIISAFIADIVNAAVDVLDLCFFRSVFIEFF